MITSNAIFAGAQHRAGVFTPDEVKGPINYDNYVLTCLVPTTWKDGVGYDATPIKLKSAILKKSIGIDSFAGVNAFLDKHTLTPVKIIYNQGPKGFYPIDVVFDSDN